MLALRLLHLLGMVGFTGFGVAAWLANRAALAAPAAEARGIDGLTRTFARLTNFGGLLAILTGIGAIRVFRYDGPQMGKETWLVAMLLGGLVAAGLAGMIAGKTRKLLAAADDARPALRKALGGPQMGLMVLLVAVIALGVLRVRL